MSDVEGGAGVVDGNDEEGNKKKAAGAGGCAGGLIAAVIGLILAIAAAFGIVSSQTATPAPVDQPFIVYGDS